MDKGTQRLGRRMLNVYREAEPIIRRRAYQHGATCREGCDHCCYQLTPLTLPEAIVIVRHLLERPGGESALDGYLARARDLLEPLVDARTPEAYAERHLACPFLGDDHRCGVYAVRPITCRTYLVVSEPSLCDLRVGVQTVEIVSMQDIHVFSQTAAALAVGEEGYQRHWVSPLPVMLALAAILVRRGRAALETAVQDASGGVLDPNTWDSIDVDSMSVLADLLRKSKISR